ncbi:MAG: hotdog fold thioesterase [Bacteroidales bacterium]|jgi:uncharacterized protein (TIGR00369 family)|nr:hotdog fold thioesterase [Bacteroidales bacterium]MCK9447450.1 hotdog fold thioesterase [Bacteroidales bacterium]MDD3700676.1 hotdog fold thioesterase [Bacteroidales bacterium]MDY0370472.1 hotdog fold thioesterase [Bacteroidales bacterium]
MNNSSLSRLNAMNKGTMMEVIGIEYIEATPGFIKARMPVDHRTHQPMGLLHGGASMALAETVGSIGSAMLVDPQEYEVRGIQMAANHLGAAREGWVIAEARILHQGRQTHVWDIVIKDENSRLISTCRLTNFILKKKVHETG